MVTNNAANNKTGATGTVLQGQGVGTASDFSTATYPSTATGTGKVLRADGTNWAASTATYPDTATGTGKVLQADGTNWVASTATFPGTATSTGTILRADGTNWVATTATYPATSTASQLLYSSATNVIGGLATANSGVLTTSSSGVPSIDTTNFAVLSTGVQMKGNNTNTAPPAGFIGQQLTASASAVATTSTTAKSITSVTLTAGVWDVSGSARSTATGGTALMQAFITGISATDNTITGSPGIDHLQYNIICAISGGVVPLTRVVISTNTTYYLVVQNFYSSTTCPTDAKITATRVG